MSRVLLMHLQWSWCHCAAELLKDMRHSHSTRIVFDPLAAFAALHRSPCSIGRHNTRACKDYYPRRCSEQRHVPSRTARGRGGTTADQRQNTSRTRMDHSQYTLPHTTQDLKYNLLGICIEEVRLASLLGTGQ